MGRFHFFLITPPILVITPRQPWTTQPGTDWLTITAHIEQELYAPEPFSKTFLGSSIALIKFAYYFNLKVPLAASFCEKRNSRLASDF
jgi:hypothetical protein